MSRTVRGCRTGVVRSVSGVPSMYRSVPGRSYAQTWCELASASKTGGPFASPTGVSTSGVVHTSEESW